MTAAAAYTAAAARIPTGIDGQPWLTVAALQGGTALDSYDPCAPLSWLILGTGGTTGSPEQLVFFHFGQFVGTATPRPLGAAFDLTRNSPSSVQVTWLWNKGGGPWGEVMSATSTFTWNGKLTRTGNLPDGAYKY